MISIIISALIFVVITIAYFCYPHKVFASNEGFIAMMLAMLAGFILLMIGIS